MKPRVRFLRFSNCYACYLDGHRRIYGLTMQGAYENWKSAAGGC